MRIRVIDEYIDNNYNIDYKKAIKVLKHEVKKRFHVKENLTLLIVNDKRIHEINNKYRHIDRPTDVISFEEHEDKYLGEIFISLDRAKAQSIEYNHSVQLEFTFLLCHGILHLLGYDHMNDADREKMFAIQDDIMSSIFKEEKNGREY